MTLTTTMANTGKARRARVRRASPARLDLTLDAVIFVFAASLCAALFFQGGLEALLGAALGAIIGARASNAMSGAPAGLWAGALFASFFHGAMNALARALF